MTGEVDPAQLEIIATEGERKVLFAAMPLRHLDEVTRHFSANPRDPLLGQEGVIIERDGEVIYRDTISPTQTLVGEWVRWADFASRWQGIRVVRDAAPNGVVIPQEFSEAIWEDALEEERGLGGIALRWTLVEFPISDRSAHTLTRLRELHGCTMGTVLTVGRRFRNQVLPYRGVSDVGLVALENNGDEVGLVLM